MNAKTKNFTNPSSGMDRQICRSESQRPYVRQWCEQNNLSFHTYNYWKHLLKEEVVEQALPDIVPLSLPVLSDSGSLLETTVPNVRSIRANRSIRSNNSNVQMQNKQLFYTK